MLHSMTGYGRVEFNIDDYLCSLEIRSLNGKQFEINTKISPLLKLYEIDLRNKIQKQLLRGSVEVNIYLKQHGVSKPMTVNTELAKYYYDSIIQIADMLQLEKKDILSSLIRMPEIVSTVNDTLDEKHWKVISVQVDQVCNILIEHRRQEGDMLAKHVLENIQSIKELCAQVAPHEKNRIERIREKLNGSIQEFNQNGKVDQNRLEQEIIFYLEKLDITEEKNRLQHHCEYFLEMLKDDSIVKGKKLGFILQEIGREINTLGSKANDVDLQKIVVMMKDELEQAKEQLLNAL
ncbi:MAG: YicC family protein [Bacteroidetes bacterium]|nr:YicC family protein [Bacteroidota bacterium]MBP6314491.1 YicC family protein [Chitinophagaceae bacterium]